MLIGHAACGGAWTEAAPPSKLWAVDLYVEKLLRVMLHDVHQNS